MLSLANGGTQFSHYIHPFRPYVSLGRSQGPKNLIGRSEITAFGG